MAQMVKMRVLRSDMHHGNQYASVLHSLAGLQRLAARPLLLSNYQRCCIQIQYIRAQAF